MRPYANEAHDLPDELYVYDLFAVVTHEGKLDNGHYWADVLSEDEWWHCDDDKGGLIFFVPVSDRRAERPVTPTTLRDVLGQKAYMLFYVKRTLAYTAVRKAGATASSPSVKTSQANKAPMTTKASVGLKAMPSAGVGKPLDMGGKKTHPIKVGHNFASGYQPC
jgi:ubiquitin carboxyl-terminal hydrolase 22/27/51